MKFFRCVWLCRASSLTGRHTVTLLLMFAATVLASGPGEAATAPSVPRWASISVHGDESVSASSFDCVPCPGCYRDTRSNVGQGSSDGWTANGD